MNRLGGGILLFLGCVIGLGIGVILVFLLQLGNFWGFHLIQKWLDWNVFKFLALSWLGIGLASELVCVGFNIAVLDVYPVMKSYRKIFYGFRNFLFGIAGGPITLIKTVDYIKTVRKNLRKDSGDNGGNFIKTVPNNPQGSETKGPKILK